ncbi:GNAT family N-acetyltransferase [Sphaerisporangium corydalis]|uniref:GNAT family N-acetyltransferase n=1 Tax=Sphaerisporangium corydalis TaxID=1441875 RepID=UPI0021CEF54A|nr:GNAT family N-acetyltransferase [Sphaerisporangium corydalis]
MSGENLDFDDLVHRAWPAPYQEALGGWVLRFADGVTKRANSVLPWAEPDDVHKAIEAAEGFYAGRGLPCVFSMGPRAAPGLDETLAARGYRVVDETAYMVASLEEEPRPAAHEVEVSDMPSEAWLDAWWAVDGRFGDGGRAAAARIVRGAPSAYAAVAEDGRPVAVGRSVLQDGTLGIYCMATMPAARRRGLGRSVLRALLAHGRGQGAVRAYLVAVGAHPPAPPRCPGGGLTPAGR